MSLKGAQGLVQTTHHKSPCRVSAHWLAARHEAIVISNSLLPSRHLQQSPSRARSRAFEEVRVKTGQGAEVIVNTNMAVVLLGCPNRQTQCNTLVYKDHVYAGLTGG